MKKLCLAMALAAAMPLFAQDDVSASKVEKSDVAQASRKERTAQWPVFFALGEWPGSPDVVGLRLTLPFSTRQEGVTGFDVGLWGRCKDFEGVAVNVLRNDVRDTCAGLQVSLYNSVVRGDLMGFQAGLWNEAQGFRGIQAGLINVCGDAQGFQLGLINRAESLYGFQVGAINVIRDAEIPFCPVVNIGF